MRQGEKIIDLLTARNVWWESTWGSQWIFSFFLCLLLPLGHKCCLKSCLFNFEFTFESFYLRDFFFNFLKALWRNVIEQICFQQQQGMFSNLDSLLNPVYAGFSWERNHRGLVMVPWCKDHLCSLVTLVLVPLEWNFKKKILAGFKEKSTFVTVLPDKD